MKRWIIGLGLCVTTLGVSAQMPKYGVKVTPEKNVDYAAFKTYSWTQGQPSHDKTIDAQVVAAVDRELAALGMNKPPSGRGDVLVTYYSLSRTDVDLKGKPDAQGTRPQYWVGTLVVALLEPETRKRLLRLRIDQPIQVDRTQLDATIDRAVADLFAQYPTRRRK